MTKQIALLSVFFSFVFTAVQAKHVDLSSKADEFRSYYHSLVQASHSGISKDQVDATLLIHPNMGVTVNASMKDNGVKFFELNAEKFSSVDYLPKALYEVTKNTDVNQTEKTSKEAIYTALMKKPITVVILPGIFSEFSSVYVFDQIFKGDSKLKSDWANFNSRPLDMGSIPAEIRKSLDPNRTKPAVFFTHDRQFQMDKFQLPGSMDGKVNAEMGHIVSMASVDSGGEPIVNLIQFHSEALTLESLGNTDFKARIFNRRLSKAFAILGSPIPENIVFIGHSRGTIVALAMLAQAHKEKLPWVKNVRAMGALGGVVFGAEDADVAFGMPKPKKAPQPGEEEKPAQPELSYQHTLALEGIYKDTPVGIQLETHHYKSVVNQIRVVHSNLLKLRRFFAILSGKESAIVPPVTSIELTALEDDTPPAEEPTDAQKLSKLDTLKDIAQKVVALQADIKSFDGMIKRGLFSPAYDQLIDFATKMASFTSMEIPEKPSVFDFYALVKLYKNVISDYSTMVLKFSRLTQALYNGAKSLTTDSRIHWWANNILPPHVHYYAFAGNHVS